MTSRFNWIFTKHRRRSTARRLAGKSALAAAVAGAIVVELPDAGHLMMVEDPGGTQDALKAFLGASPKTFGGRLSAIG